MSTILDSNSLHTPNPDIISEAGGEAAHVADSVRSQDRVFDAASQRDWCELIRDVAAVANSEGGQLVLRLSARMSSAGTDASNIVERLAQFTDADFADIQVADARDADSDSVVLRVGRALFPIVFTKAGHYVDDSVSSNRVEVFAPGSVYFWKVDKAQPANSRDLQAFIEHVLSRMRHRWSRGIRRVMKQPVQTMLGKTRSHKRSAADGQANLQPVRIVTDPNAPALQPQDVDRLYPLRQKDLVAELNRRLGRRAVNSYDVQAVRRQHRLDERPDFVFHLPGAGRRYSSAVLEWIVDQKEREPEFFAQARAADNEMLKLRRRKPR